MEQIFTLEKPDQDTYSDVRFRMYGKDKKGSEGVLKDIIYNL